MNLRSMIESTEVTTWIQEGSVEKADLFSNFTLGVIQMCVFNIGIEIVFSL